VIALIPMDMSSSQWRGSRCPGCRQALPHQRGGRLGHRVCSGCRGRTGRGQHAERRRSQVPPHTPAHAALRPSLVHGAVRVESPPLGPCAATRGSYDPGGGAGPTMGHHRCLADLDELAEHCARLPMIRRPSPCIPPTITVVGSGVVAAPNAFVEPGCLTGTGTDKWAARGCPPSLLHTPAHAALGHKLVPWPPPDRTAAVGAVCGNTGPGAGPEADHRGGGHRALAVLDVAVERAGGALMLDAPVVSVHSPPPSRWSAWTSWPFPAALDVQGPHRSPVVLTANAGRAVAYAEDARRTRRTAGPCRQSSLRPASQCPPGRPAAVGRDKAVVVPGSGRAPAATLHSAGRNETAPSFITIRSTAAISDVLPRQCSVPASRVTRPLAMPSYMPSRAAATGAE
jgi:hypothetical protein